VRYAKYVTIGSLVTAVGATAFGSVISGVAAPTSFGVSIIAAIVWYFGKWGAHRLQREWGKSRTRQGDEGIKDNPELMDSSVRRDGTWRQQMGPGVVPW
jgi:hypothetical protein